MLFSFHPFPARHPQTHQASHLLPVDDRPFPGLLAVYRIRDLLRRNNFWERDFPVHPVPERPGAHGRRLRLPHVRFRLSSLPGHRVLQPSRRAGALPDGQEEPGPLRQDDGAEGQSGVILQPHHARGVVLREADGHPLHLLRGLLGTTNDHYPHGSVLNGREPCKISSLLQNCGHLHGLEFHLGSCGLRPVQAPPPTGAAQAPQAPLPVLLAAGTSNSFNEIVPRYASTYLE
ncbi:hypothetical protein AVEN_54165-1 [Araneus ventricosus]|uniref:Uncharacterized protein n=1 Tax=Araneus ventricosus TaxID=182803 RepID=A0A4Y2R5Y7_ARAVE|nr:hypothetical protein AVEN_54165-1 [Araneus ventricosus]